VAIYDASGAATLAEEGPSDTAGAARRREYLRIAAAVFAQDGYDRTSVATLAKAFGIQKPTFYHYFPSKQAVLETLLEASVESLLRDSRSAVEHISEPRARLLALMHCHAMSIDRDADSVKVFLMERRSLKKPFSFRYVSLRDEYEELIIDTVASGQAEHRFMAGDAKCMAYGILGMYNWLIQWYRRDGPLSIEDIHQTFANILMHGIEA
jgi:AcrR family transcriptional regulator